jgi:hypothetical protein
MWAEETATDLLLEKTWPDVWHRKFTRKRESVVGADWLWWWIDASGTSLGLLTQAKVLKRKGPRWDIDFDYRPKGAESSQIETLIDASRVFNVPAAHVLYCGTPAYRRGLDCGQSHPDGGNCSDRKRAGVSMVPSIYPAAVDA